MSRLRSLPEFLQSSSAPVIDLRTKDEFLGCHLKGSTHIPLDDIIERMYELPKRDVPLRLCGSLEILETAERKLSDKGYHIDATLDWNKLHPSELNSSLFESGNCSIQLWSPAPIVRYFNEEVWRKRQVQDESMNMKALQQNQTVAPSALDIACGSGRDSVYLAQDGWQVTAIDYLSGALEKTQQLGLRNGVDLETIQLDLESENSSLEGLNRTFDMVQVIRYLHRPLFASIKSLLNPGGYIVYQTFMEGCEEFGKPKNPRFILKKGELSREFSGFNVLVDDVELLQDGRPTNIFIAQKAV